MNALDAKQWLEYSHVDLAAAKKLIEESETFSRQVCYLAQQAAEKALKSILVLMEIEFPRTHDLDRLRELIPTGWKVKESFPELYGLTIWAIESRYPSDLSEVSLNEARIALELAEQLVNTVTEDFLSYTG